MTAEEKLQTEIEVLEQLIERFDRWATIARKQGREEHATAYGTVATDLHWLRLTTLNVLGSVRNGITVEELEAGGWVALVELTERN